MYEIKVTDEFCGAHNLRNYKGKCEALHGHNWKVELSVFSDTLNSQGMVMDFKDLKNAIKKVTSGLDHKYLNDIEYFKKTNPTSENIARFIHTKMGTKVGTHPIFIKNGMCPYFRLKVTVWETETSCASFYDI